MLPDFQSIDLVDGTTIYEGEAGVGNTETAKKWKIRRTTVADGKTSRMFPIGQNTNGGPSKGYEFSFSDAKVLTYAVGIDSAAPTLSTVTIASNNSTTTLAKTGDTVTLTIIASEVLENISATIAGNTATIVPGVDGAHWTATYVMQSGDTAGVVPFQIVFADNAGNAGTVVTAVTGGGSVTFDKVVLASDSDLNSVNQGFPIAQTLTIATEGVKVTVGNPNIGGAAIATTGSYSTTISVTGTASAVAGLYSGNITVADAAGNTKVIVISIVVTEEI